jgi:hypothetical protein
MSSWSHLGEARRSFSSSSKVSHRSLILLTFSLETLLTGFSFSHSHSFYSEIEGVSHERELVVDGSRRCSLLSPFDLIFVDILRGDFGKDFTSEESVEVVSQREVSSVGGRGFGPRRMFLHILFHHLSESLFFTWKSFDPSSFDDIPTE